MITFRNAIGAIFGGAKQYAGTQWREIGGYFSRFVPFGANIYANDIVRSCIRVLAEHSSKAAAKVVRRGPNGRIAGDQRLQRLIQYRPNLYMNGKDFLAKVRTRLEIDNTVFIYIRRDDLGRCMELYPMPPAFTEAIDVGGLLFIRFRFTNGATMVASWEDLAVLRKDYNTSDIWGDNNAAILTSLELLGTAQQGMGNAIKSTANLRGILKATKGMLTDDDVKRIQDRFVQSYMKIENASGVAAIDSTQEFIPINMQPAIANYKSIEELRNNVYRYFGVNEDILMSKAFGDAWEAFYEARLEPFLVAMGLELTNKVFSERERGYGNEIIFEANRLAYVSTTVKMNMVQLIDRGVMTINEYREVLNLAPVDGGDVRVIRKEYAEATKLNEIQGVSSNAGQSGTGISGNEPDGSGEGPEAVPE